MKFSISSSDLLKQLQIAGGVIAGSPVIPILEDFLFQVRLNTLTLVASDLETTITASLPIIADSEGDVAIPARILIDTIKALPAQPVTFNIDITNNKVELTSSNGKYQMGCENASDFPEVPQVNEIDQVTLSASVLGEGIQNTLFATSTDELRPVMTGVLFELDFSKLTLVATDAHKLVRSLFTGLESNVAESFIVPRKALQMVRNALPEMGDVQVAFNKNNAFFSFNDISIVCRLIEGRYPDYNSVIPVENPLEVVVNRADFLGTVKRISIFANKTTNQIVLNIADSNIQVSAQDLDYSNEAVEQLGCTYNGEPITIGFNAKFLAEMLNAMTGDEIVLRLSTPSRAGILEPTEQADNHEILMLIMPVGLNS
jgi:DNA polymerase-3 subunit beta